MVDFALTKNATLASSTGKVKNVRHAECGDLLTKLDNGQYYCPTCWEHGYPVRRKVVRR